MALTATIPAAAQQPQGKLLTMEETILSRELSPASYPVRWVAQSDSYSITDGTAIVAVNARSGKRSTVITLEELNRLLSADFKAFPAYSFEDENTLVVISNGVRSTIDLRRSSIVASSRVPEGVAIMKLENVSVSITGNSTNPTRFQHPVAGTYKKWCVENGVKYFSVASGGGTGRTLHPDNMAAGPASYGMTDTMGRMHSDAQFAGSSSVPAHVEMMGLIGMGNNPMVGATVAVAVAIQEGMSK